MGDIEAIILHNLIMYLPPAVFVVAAFFGDAGIVASFVFALRTQVPILEVLLAAVLGTLIADTIWYYFGKSILSFLRKRFHRYYKNEERMLKAVNKYIPANKPGRLLLVTKFMYGTRVLTIIYLSFNRLAFKRFALLDSIATFFYLGTLFIATKLFVVGTYKLLSSVNDVVIALIALVLSFILVRAISEWLIKKVQQNNGANGGEGGKAEDPVVNGPEDL